MVDNYLLDMIFFRHKQLSILNDNGNELKPDVNLFPKFQNIKKRALEKLTSRYAIDVIYAKKRSSNEQSDGSE